MVLNEVALCNCDELVALISTFERERGGVDEVMGFSWEMSVFNGKFMGSW